MATGMQQKLDEKIHDKKDWMSVWCKLKKDEKKTVNVIIDDGKTKIHRFIQEIDLRKNEKSEYEIVFPDIDQTHEGWTSKQKEFVYNLGNCNKMLEESRDGVHTLIFLRIKANGQKYKSIM